MTALTALALAFAILIGLLAVPLELQFRLSSGEGLEQRVRLVWAFGLARFSLPSGRTKPDKDAPGKARAKTRRRSRSRSRTRRALDVLRNELLRRRVLRYLADVWSAIKKRDMHVHARIGLGDPADTGQLWAVAGPVAAALSNIRDATVNIQPDFDDDVLELDTSGTITAMPLQLIGLTLLLLMSPTLLRHLLRR